MEKGQHCTVHHLQEKKTNYQTSSEGSTSQALNKWKRFSTQETADAWKPMPNSAARSMSIQTSTWNMNLLRVTQQTQHRKFRKPPKWDKDQAWETTSHVCPVVQPPMTSLYGHCWEKDAVTEEPSIWAHLGTLTASIGKFSLLTHSVLTVTSCWHHFALSSRDLPSVHYRVYNKLFRNAECQNPKRIKSKR